MRYFCIETKQDVQANQAGHDGTLLDGMREFKEGQWIIDNGNNREIVNDTDFVKQYTKDQSIVQRPWWEESGWKI